MKKVSYAPQGIDLPELKGQQIQIPKKVIDLNQAVTYYNNFYQTRLANGSKEAKRAVWFEFTALKNYFKDVTKFCAAKNVEITRFAFLLGADKNNARTIVIAPVTYDEQLDLHRAFSFDNNKITYIHRFAGEAYSTVKDFDQLQSLDQSLLLCDSNTISSAAAIGLYNNYHDAITAPFADVVASDTRFVYYEKGEFEAYLSFLEEQAMAKNLDLSGLNVVFGVRNNHDIEGVFANLLTLFFAPTKGKSINSFSSFDLPKKNVINFSLNRLEFKSDEISTLQLSTLFNRGNSGPPPFGWD